MAPFSFSSGCLIILVSVKLLQLGLLLELCYEYKFLTTATCIHTPLSTQLLCHSFITPQPFLRDIFQVSHRSSYYCLKKEYLLTHWSSILFKGWLKHMHSRHSSCRPCCGMLGMAHCFHTMEADNWKRNVLRNGG